MSCYADIRNLFRRLLGERRRRLPDGRGAVAEAPGLKLPDAATWLTGQGYAVSRTTLWRQCRSGEIQCDELHWGDFSSDIYIPWSELHRLIRERGGEDPQGA